MFTQDLHVWCVQINFLILQTGSEILHGILMVTGGNIAIKTFKYLVVV